MRIIRPAAALVAAVAAGTALTAAAMPASASPSVSRASSWHVSLKFADGFDFGFGAVTATSTHNAWAFGENRSNRAMAYQLSGSTWKQRSFPNDDIINASSTSASNVWAFGLEQALRYNGSKWSLVKTFPQEVSAGLAISTSDVWVFTGTTTLWRYNGSSWSKSKTRDRLAGGSALSPSSVWAYGGKNIGHWNGKSWSWTSVARLLPRNTQISISGLNGVYAASSRNVYAIGTGGRESIGGALVLLHYNGHRWSRVGFNGKVGNPLSVVPDGSGGVWITEVHDVPGRSTIQHYSHGRLSTGRLPYSPNRIGLPVAAHMPGSTQTLAVGYTRKSLSSSNRTAVILRYGP
jgi:hypothetical protein